MLETYHLSYLNFLEIRKIEIMDTTAHQEQWFCLFLMSEIWDQEQLVSPSGSNKNLPNTMVESQYILNMGE